MGTQELLMFASVVLGTLLGLAVVASMDVTVE